VISSLRSRGHLVTSGIAGRRVITGLVAVLAASLMVLAIGCSTAFAGWFQTQEWKAGHLGNDTAFGWSVAADGDTMVVGAPGEVVGGVRSGAAYVFTRAGSGWRQVAKLTGGAGQAGFGESVSISGTTVVVGAPKLNSNKGEAYVFVRPAFGWADATGRGILERLSVTPPNNANFGQSVTVKGDIVVVGTPGENKALVFRSGAGGNWQDPQPITALVGPHPGSPRFGESLTMSEETIVVGGNSANLSIYSRRGASWGSSTAMSTLPTTPPTAEVGSSDRVQLEKVAISADGKTIAAGAPSSHSTHGAVYVFSKQPSGAWPAQQNAVLGAARGNGNSRLGYTLAVSNAGVIAAGAPGANVDGVESGAVYLYQPPTGGWADKSETTRLTRTTGAGRTPVQANDGFGWGVAFSGEQVVAGALNHNHPHGGGPAVNHSGGLYTFVNDITGPMIRLSSPTRGQVFSLNQAVTVSYECADSESGIESCVGTVPNGGRLNTSQVGTHWFTVTARDNAGNVTTERHRYRVAPVTPQRIRPIPKPPAKRPVRKPTPVKKPPAKKPVKKPAAIKGRGPKPPANRRPVIRPVPPKRPAAKPVPGRGRPRIIKGNARFARYINSPRRRPFSLVVRGRQIATVTYFVDGKRVKVMRVRPNQKGQSVRLVIDPRRLRLRKGRHQVTVRITFARSSKTGPKRIKRTIRRG
jgi:hypothetical protein